MLALTTAQSIVGATTFMNRITSIVDYGYAGFSTRMKTMSAPIMKP